MQITCRSCGAKGSIADEKVKPGMRVCCPRCKGSIEIPAQFNRAKKEDVIIDRKEERKAMNEIRCKTCESGTLFKKKIYKMSSPVVVIGYILLIPSVLGILLSGIVLIASWAGAGAAATRKLNAETIRQLEAVNVPDDLTEKLKKGFKATESDMVNLTAEQKTVVRSSNVELDAANVATGCLAACGTSFALIGAILSFIGGLLGWILVMKKRVLACNRCGATIDAA